MLGIPADNRAADFVSMTSSGRFNVTEVKASTGRAGADIEHALGQIENTISALDEAVDGGVKLRKLEIVVPSGANLSGGYSVVGDHLVRITDEGTEVVKVNGSVVHLTELAP